MTKALIAIVLFAGLAGNAAADWTLLEKSPAGEVYIDNDTVRKKDDMAIVWALYQYPAPVKRGPNSYLSMKAHYKFECLGTAVRSLYVSYHSGKMAEGATLKTEMNPIALNRDSPALDALWKAACAKK